MPKGITQEQVNAAADALIAAGDKPTVEKIRQALGTGSPNTVTRMMDVWRGTLAQRLQEAIRLPDVPPEAGQAFADVWRLALSHAETLARAALIEDQNTLFAAQSDLTQERKLWEIALAEAQANVAEHATQRAQAETQLRERQVLVDQMEAQRVDLVQQRDRLQTQVDQQQLELHTLRGERATALNQVRGLEDRAHQQIDHARQEVKALQQLLERAQREHAKTTAQLTAQQDSLRAALHTAEQASAHQAGQIRALETALTQWRNAPAPSKLQAGKSSSAAKGKSKRPAKQKIR
ncbi:DNA-binding protein [Dyella choica]|uniref:DNA-binding protein n=1 Tax=Dyella choica TaxID=1927959 RepID=A0A432M9A0_9GAMM|nr:DNA-binding protein [Dyella choica]RUL78775.1 DNA-binding protein [Dyella choica]